MSSYTLILIFSINTDTHASQFFSVNLLNEPLVNEQVLNEEKKIIYLDELKLINQRLLDWKNSWQKGNIKEYLAFYRPNYAPSKLSHNQWVNQRKVRITKAKNISIILSINDISINGDVTSAQTIFIQEYKSKFFKDKVNKKIYWIRVEGTWLIDKEFSIQDIK